MHVRYRTRRFYLPSLPVGRSAELTGAEAHHALHVVRVNEGDEVELFDGSGWLARATVLARGRRSVQLLVEQGHLAERPVAELRLGFAVPKGKRLDWLLEKATELGATDLHPVRFERSVAGEGEWKPAKVRRWKTQLVAATKQCGRAMLPELHPPADLADCLHCPWWCEDEARLLGDLMPEARPIGEVLAGDTQRGVSVLVGPEGGLTGRERTDLLQAGWSPVVLGRNILRTETACAALLAAVQAILDRGTSTGPGGLA